MKKQVFGRKINVSFVSRLVTFGRNTATGDFFINAKDGSPIQKVFQNNMDGDSFQISKQDALSLTLTETKTALYWFKEDIQSDEDTFCKVFVIPPKHF